MGWDCPRCSAENSLDANSCWRCGYKYFPGYDAERPGSPATGVVKDPAAKTRERIQEEVRASVDDSLERARARIDRILGGSGSGSPGGGGA